MPIELPPLPWSKDALDPHLSAETLELHHGKHHRAYVTKTNELVKGTPFESKGLEEIVRTADGSLFNNAAQVWNHTFYWNSMKPKGGGAPKGALGRALEKQFQSFDGFREAFTKAAVGHFGSGWAWLVLDGDRPAILATHDADNPLRRGVKALLACDLWEHAYYVDYRNERPKYVAAFLDHLANWDWAEENLSKR